MHESCTVYLCIIAEGADPAVCDVKCQVLQAPKEIW